MARRKVQCTYQQRHIHLLVLLPDTADRGSAGPVSYEGNITERGKCEIMRAGARRTTFLLRLENIYFVLCVVCAVFQNLPEHQNLDFF